MAGRESARGLILYPILGIGGVLLTIAAAIACHFDAWAPYAAALQQALDGFKFWSYIRGVCQISDFGANMWALVAILRCYQ
jgi:hypothetical protein